MQNFVHYFLHFGFPLIIAFSFFRKNWKQAYLLLLATMLIDLDHLLAEPIFDPTRCSINFHPLHGYYALFVYFVLLFLKKPFNIIGIGLIWHLATDLIDCMIMYTQCATCLADSPAKSLMEFIAKAVGI